MSNPVLQTLNEQAPNKQTPNEQMLKDLALLEPLELPDGFHERLMLRLEKTARPQIRFTPNAARTAAAAACAVFVVGAAISLPSLFTRPQPQGAAYVAQNEAAYDGALTGGAEAGAGVVMALSEDVKLESFTAADTAANAPSVRSALLSAAPAEIGDMVIKRYSATITAEDVEGTLKRIESLGQTQTSGGWGYLTESAGGYVTITVPASEYDGVITQVEALGDVTYAHENQQSVAADFSDARARLNAKHMERERLTELLSKTTRVNDMLQVEGRLSNVLYDIDNYQGQMNGYIAQASTPTIAVTVQSEGRAAPAEPVPLAERMGKAFGGSVDAVVAVAQAVAQLLAFAFVPLVIVGAVALAAWLIVRTVGRGKRK